MKQSNYKARIKMKKHKKKVSNEIIKQLIQMNKGNVKVSNKVICISGK